MARSPRRRDDRYARDRPSDRYRDRYDDRRDDRSYRRRSRSRDRDRRYDDRDYDRSRDHDHGRRRERSPDRDRVDRPPRRDRSHDRKRSRERSPVRDRRSGSDRYRDDRSHVDEPERKRARQDDGSHRGSSRDRQRDSRRSPQDVGSPDKLARQRSVLTEQTRREPDRAPSAGDLKKLKQAKVEEWKKKVMQEKQQKENSNQTPPSPSAIPEETTKAPAVASPVSNHASPATPGEEAKPASPAPYAGKFDPKAIAKRAAAAMEKQKAALGGDVVIPKSASDASNTNRSNLADSRKAAEPNPPRGTSSVSLADAKITGFGLNKVATEKSDKAPSTKAAAPLDEDEESERKLEKLPDLPTNIDTGDAALANDDDDQDDGDDIRSDEEEAEAAREAAQKRAEEVQAEQGDIVMTNGEALAAQSESKAPIPAADADKMDEDEEVDPLDAFMTTLEQPGNKPMHNSTVGRVSKKEPQVFNSDDEDEMDAVGNDNEDILAMAAKRKKKEIPLVNHSKVQYEDFRKKFYSESVELAEMTPESIAILRSELDNIHCRGADVPTPIVKWSQGGFGAQILDVIREMKFEKPTSIQSQALPAIMSGRDVIGIAKTGSGKTVAFILPMFRHIKDQRPVENLEGPIGLVLAPTRELATQIYRDCKPYLKALNLRAVCAYGGAPIKDQIAELKRGAEIVVCTPGRFIDLLAANSGRVVNLKRVTYVVLDEADRMFDMGFEPQITKIMTNIRPQRQTVLFSATFPKNMESLARKILTKPIEITVGGRSVVAPEITQVIEVRKQDAKFRRLLELLGELHDRDEDARSLVFVEKQETADSMFADLTRRGYPCVSIHGGRDQVDRDQAISDFKAGIIPVMIATSVAARGLDVKQLKLVVNYDSPNHAEDYVHRSGRTGRAGNTGTAVTFVTPEQDRFAPFLVKALKDSKQEVPEDLTNLAEAHQQRVKAGDAKKIGSGFGGRGIENLEAARDAQRALERGKYKTGDEPEEETDQAKKKADDNKTKVDSLLAKATSGVKDRDAQGEKSDHHHQQQQQQPTERKEDAAIPTALTDHLNNAMKVQKAEKPAAVTNDPLARAAAAAAGINTRLGARGTMRPGVPIDNRGPDAGAFHATLEINDFPQRARWGVTNRTNVAKILEATGTSITTKGNYYKPPAEPQAGEQPKLYILVEGDTEVQVTNAMTELTRLLTEGTLAAFNDDARAPTGGRYSVV